MVTGAGWDLGGDAPVVPRENLRKIRKSNSESPAIPWNFCAPFFCFFLNFLFPLFACLLACFPFLLFHCFVFGCLCFTRLTLSCWLVSFILKKSRIPFFLSFSLSPISLFVHLSIKKALSFPFIQSFPSPVSLPFVRFLSRSLSLARCLSPSRSRSLSNTHAPTFHSSFLASLFVFFFFCFLLSRYANLLRTRRVFNELQVARFLR